MQEADTGCSDRASSADGIEGAVGTEWGNLVAFDTSEDCLSESEYPTAPPRETRNKKGGPLRDRPFDFGARDP